MLRAKFTGPRKKVVERVEEVEGVEKTVSMTEGRGLRLNVRRKM